MGALSALSRDTTFREHQATMAFEDIYGEGPYVLHTMTNPKAEERTTHNPHWLTVTPPVGKPVALSMNDMWRMGQFCGEGSHVVMHDTEEPRHARRQAAK